MALHPAQPPVKTGSRSSQSVLIGSSRMKRTDYPEAELGEMRSGISEEEIYVLAPAAIPGATAAVTYTAPVQTLNADGTRTLTTVRNATAATGAGWNSDRPFLAGEYGWVWRAKTV